jgi:hypothetical protein
MLPPTPLPHLFDQYPDIRAVVAEITPEVAEDLLTRNVRNRKLKEATIRQWVRDIQAGNWEMNGEAIKFATDGSLLDGQNRLTAVVRAETPIHSVVIYGLPNKAQDTMDQGVKRTVADVLSLNGYANSTVLASTVALLARYESGEARKDRHVLTSPEAEDYILNHPSVTQAAHAAAVYRKGIPEMLAPVIGASYYLFSEIDPAAATEFFESMANSQTEGRGDPRATLLALLRRSRSQNQIWDRLDQLNLVIRAWNVWRQGKSITVFRQPRSGKAAKPI